MATLVSVVAPVFFMPASYFIVSPADTPMIESLSTSVSMTFIDISGFVVRATVALAVLSIIGFPKGGVPVTLHEVVEIKCTIRMANSYGGP